MKQRGSVRTATARLGEAERRRPAELWTPVRLPTAVAQDGAASPSDPSEGSTGSFAWQHSPFVGSLGGGCLFWAAFPPVGWSWLVWLAPLPWLALIRCRTLPGRRPYLQIWLGASLAWLVLLEGVRRAHPANHLGWFALSLYLAGYLAAFIALSRVAHHRLGVPLWMAAPVVWVSFELVRGHLLTGFSLALLGHALAEWTWLIQIADVAGAYGVSFLILLLGACGMTAVCAASRSDRRMAAGLAVAVLLACVGYGNSRMRSAPGPDATPRLSAALLQGTRDKVFEPDREGDERTLRQYWDLMQRAREAQRDLDLFVWPEAAFSSGINVDFVVEGAGRAPPQTGLTDAEFQERMRGRQRSFADYASMAANRVNHPTAGRHQAVRRAALLVGAETVQLGGDAPRIYNSALLIDADGRVANRYYKMHRVMFGEYLPWGDVFPWIYSVTPMRQGISAGATPRMFEVNGFRLAPSICFEITVPHLIRRQCNHLERDQGALPDVLVNVTDDGWFWGTTILDLQLACGLFRAVEMRRPLLVAANTGISAVVDGNGRLLRRAPKRHEQILVADLARDGRYSFYRQWGDLAALVCLAITAGWLIQGSSLFSRFSRGAPCGRGSQPPSEQASTSA